ncbi:MAG: hypothetical protein JRN26_02465 [Nitrososphaerota archaeon]|jgi:predicted AAA+ superfamily ATPase|nr:hypothetical protein [Nitrososphaerota archaeon]MDG6929623.1 hypothetical protein [Nitrososphaerota archaeon]MDG6932396.1 hypothetical protein [Nitrososphaerota archaeon]MDG6935739.1 hypothetical protein [Nitrososphaerota archaeon]MDG6944725.1 hypothetical protein [Nitrososphaerota archaeon]
MTFAFSADAYYRKLGNMLEAYAVNALDAQFYFRLGSKEIDAVLKTQNGPVAVEVKENASEYDVRRLEDRLACIGAKKGIMLSLSEVRGKRNVRVMPVYAAETIKLQ